jgi:hypothetical protein
MAPAGDPLELRFKTTAGTAQAGDILLRGGVGRTRARVDG